MNRKIENAVIDYGKTFAAALITAYTASGRTPFTATSNDLKTWLTAAIGAVLPLIFIALTPTNGGYGIQAKATQLPTPPIVSAAQVIAPQTFQAPPPAPAPAQPPAPAGNTN